ncbi:MAG: M23 family metallopeptidase [Xanthobacteraceae bacterium]|nr:M23 family metallopeptidase [Xanthobacteraceae bacterium]
MAAIVALRSRALPRVVVLRALALAVVAVGAAACSSEATRFNNGPYASQQEATGSIQQQRAPAGSVQTSSLPPPSGSQPATIPASGVSGGGRGMASYHPGQQPDPVTTGSVQAPPYSQSPHALPPPVQKARAPSGKIAPTQPVVHVVAPGETLIALSRKYKMPLAELARLNNIPAHTKLNIGDRISIPASRAAARANEGEQKVAAQPKALSAPKAKAAEPKTAAPKAQPKAGPQLASTQPTETASVATPTEPPPAANPVRAGNSSLSFRWPAKGRIIAGFGPKTNGQANDGINIALPEGTPIKAAEDGVVAYAGNELKGYGNLVLIRHADGYVTAYAHAKELLVKRGDPIKRGQTIARAGQTGNVDAPQLHFEIRKGPSPIDPMPHLSGG